MVASYETENQELHKIPAYWGAGLIPLIYNLLSVAFMSLSITYHKGWHNENECNNTLILYMQRTHNYFCPTFAPSVREIKKYSHYT